MQTSRLNGCMVGLFICVAIYVVIALLVVLGIWLIP